MLRTTGHGEQNVRFHQTLGYVTGWLGIHWTPRIIMPHPGAWQKRRLAYLKEKQGCMYPTFRTVNW
jgi:hypothetical protein